MTASTAAPRTRLEREDAQRALRTLLARPLLTQADGEDLARVLRWAGHLRDWLHRHTGWRLAVEPGLVRLLRTPARLDDPSHPASEPKQDQPFTRRRYVLLCLALAHLERAGRQTTLRKLMEEIQGQLAGDPYLAAQGMALDPQRREDRSDLVAVGRLLLQWQVLAKVQGDEDGFLRGAPGALAGGLSDPATSDVLYSIQRQVLARLPGWQASPARLGSVATSHAARRSALHPEPGAAVSSDDPRPAARQRLMRRLLECPVVYAADLDPQAAEILRDEGRELAAQAAAATGLVPEVRAEGLALVDEDGDLVDLPIGSEGTDGHATLLVADLLNAAQRQSDSAVPLATIEAALDQAARTFPWREDTREPEGLRRLVREVVARLAANDLATVADGVVRPRPALARYALAPEDEPTAQGTQLSLFDEPDAGSPQP